MQAGWIILDLNETLTFREPVFDIELFLMEICRSYALIDIVTDGHIWVKWGVDNLVYWIFVSHKYLPASDITQLACFVINLNICLDKFVVTVELWIFFCPSSELEEKLIYIKSLLSFPLFRVTRETGTEKNQPRQPLILNHISVCFLFWPGLPLIRAVPSERHYHPVETGYQMSFLVEVWSNQ